MTLHIPELPDDCDTLRAALLYAGAGWYVLPVSGSSKHAGSVVGREWQTKSSRDPGQIVAWFAGTDHGLALHVGRSGAVVFDVDDPAAVPAELREAIIACGPPHQATRVAEAGRGHYVFAAPAGTIGNSVGELGPGWGDVRGANGIVVVAPTPHEKAAEGGLYAWRSTGALPELPDGLRARLRPPGGGAGAVDHAGLTGWLEALPDGEPDAAVLEVPTGMPARQRHDAMAAAVLRLVRLAEQGHLGVRGRLVSLGLAFIAAVTPDRRGGEPEARAEFQRAVAGAIGITAAAPTPTLPVVDLPDELAALVMRWWSDRGDPFDDPAGVAGGEAGAAGEPDPLGVMRSRLLTPSQVMARPSPSPLVSGLLYRDSLAWLIGKSGTFKSFIALDVAAHVAAGQAWAGRRVWGGPVVYMAAEGAGGMTLRQRAWVEKNGPMSDDLLMLPGAVQVNGEHWSTFVALCAEVRPALVVVDTQARVSVGVRENDNGEMGQLIDRLDLLRRATSACVWVVHHIGRQGTDARGASAIDAAQDTELRAERVGGPKAMRASVSVDKQKDAPDTDAIGLALERVELGADPATGEPLSSLVVVPDLLTDPFPIAPWREVRNENQGLILRILGEHFTEGGGTRAEVAAVLREQGQRGGPKWVKTTFYDAWEALSKKDLIERIPGTQRFVLANLATDATSTDGSGI